MFARSIATLLLAVLLAPLTLLVLLFGLFRGRGFGGRGLWMRPMRFHQGFHHHGRR
jgi:hypothetical protein